MLVSKSAFLKGQFLGELGRPFGEEADCEVNEDQGQEDVQEVRLHKGKQVVGCLLESFFLSFDKLLLPVSEIGLLAQRVVDAQGLLEH